MAGYFELRHRLDHQAGVDGLRDAVVDELRGRDKWRSTLIVELVPYLRRKHTTIHNLYSVMRSEPDEAFACALATAWLTRYPGLSAEVEIELLDRLLASGRVEPLRRLAAERAAQPLVDERRRNWDAVQLIVDIDVACARLNGAIDSELLWHVRARMGDRRRDSGRDAAALSVPQLAWLIAAFRPLWPRTSWPTGSSSGDVNPWDASDYIGKLITRLGNLTSDAALTALATLRTAPEDGYTDTIKIVQAEQRQKRAEGDFVPPTLAAITAALGEGPPQTVGDLQVVVLDLLALLQARIRSDETDLADRFSPGGAHLAENACRDLIVGLLGVELRYGITAATEVDMRASKRADIGFSLGRMRLPVEVKGQWHKDLWTAADDQLDALYAPDWRADRKGIYLVLWFGPGTPLPNPSGGAVGPKTPDALRTMLIANSGAAQRGDVAVVVLDLTPPT